MADQQGQQQRVAPELVPVPVPVLVPVLVLVLVLVLWRLRSLALPRMRTMTTQTIEHAAE